MGSCELIFGYVFGTDSFNVGAYSFDDVGDGDVVALARVAHPATHVRVWEGQAKHQVC